MNILYLTTHLNPGGITSYLLTLSRAMKQKGHTVYIAASSGELLPRFQEAGITYIPVPINTKQEISLAVVRTFFILARKVKEYNIDIIHAQTRVAQVASCLLEIFCRTPYVSTCHGFFKKRLFRMMFPCWGRLCIAISQQVQDHLVNDFKLSGQSIRLVSNGIDLDRFIRSDEQTCLKTRKELGLGNALVVGILARLSEVKGHRYLIEAMKLVSARIVNARLLIIGEGKIKKDLMDLCDSLAISDKIIFLPNVLETVRFLSIMDVFVMPSLHEGLGLSLMEAMALGLAVIGSDVGGIKSLIQHNSNGLLVKPADPAELSCAIIALLEDQKRREQLAFRGQSFIRENFSQSKMAAQTQRVYEECLNIKNRQ
ncbi:MAG: glycosyltransferase family 4 protein [Candidatus Omnitrophota bacterium]|jgi:glycosyltransferase involved in cell wall biosynthesis